MGGSVFAYMVVYHIFMDLGMKEGVEMVGKYQDKNISSENVDVLTLTV